jgi:tetratricopeptide (TPR) repeat protein
MMPPTMRHLPKVAKALKVSVLFAVASCAGLECDEAKRESIKHANLGVEKMLAQSQAEAVKEFELAIQLDPTNHLAAYNLGQVQEKLADGKCAQAGANSSDCTAAWDKAAESFTKAVNASGDDAMYTYKLGRALQMANKLDLARQALEKAAKINPKLFKVHLYLGEIHEAQGRPKEAALAYSESARLNPSFGKPFIALGKLYYKWDKFEEAVKVLQQGAEAVTRDPEARANINYQLGLCYDALQQWDNAIAAYQKALEDAPGDIETKLQLGFSYAEKGDKANAKKFLGEYTKSAGSGEANAFKLTAANTRLFKIMAEESSPPPAPPQ